MTTQESTEKLAKEMVEFYREEFPGEGPDWDSDWWTACKNWDEDEFSVFLQSVNGFGNSQLKPR